MKTFIKIILKILLPIFLLLITMSFIIENMAVKTISDDILVEEVSGYMLDEIINEVDNDNLSKIAEKIENSPYMEEITEKYLDVLSGKSEKINIEEEINQILDEDLKGEIPENIKEDVKSYVNEKSEEVENKLEMGTEGDSVTKILNIYGKITSFEFRITLIIICLLDVIILVVLEKQNVLKTIGITMFIVAIISILVLIIINILSTYIKQRLSGGWIDNINLNSLIGCIIAEVIIGFILLIITKVLNMKGKNEVTSDNKN